MNSVPEIEIQNLSVTFNMYDRGLRQKNVKVISNLCLKAEKGEVLAVVGSSGSGKSLLAHAIMGILPKNAVVTGSMKYKGLDITEKRIKEIRGKEICLIPQSVSYLDPLMKVGNQVMIKNNKSCFERMRKAFRRYDLCENSENLYPFQYSGGMARRALISTAEQTEPSVIIADEPTPGLDRKMAYRTLKYFRDFADRGKAVIMITHDIDIAVEYADKISVFYGGTTLETTRAENFIKGEKYLYHPYTKALYNALPQNGFKPVKGFQHSPYEVSEGCIYFDRCDKRQEKCRGNIPVSVFDDGSCFVRCIYGHSV